MGLFIRDDSFYDESRRMTGFNRYKQLMSFYGVNWVKLNLITTVGFTPYAALNIVALLSSSSLVMLGGSFVGGMIFGPFFAALFSSIMKGMMDAPGRFWENYRKGWKQNFLGSLLPGGFFGLISGMFLFMAYMMWNGAILPTKGTIALYLFSLLVFALINLLLWPQLVLFNQSFLVRMRNTLLFTAKYLWKVIGVSVLILLWVALMILFAPFTLLIIPLLGFWFIILIAELIIYEDLNYELDLESSYGIVRETGDEDEEE